MTTRKTHTNSENVDENIKATRFILDVFIDRLRADREQATSITADVENQIKDQEAKLIRHVARLLFLKWCRSRLRPSSQRKSSDVVVSCCSSEAQQLQPVDVSAAAPVHMSASTATPFAAVDQNQTSNDAADVADTEKFFKMLNIPELATQHAVDCVGVLSSVVSATDTQLNVWFDSRLISVEHRRRLLTACKNLRNYTAKWIETGEEPSETEFKTNDLCWFSFERGDAAAGGSTARFRQKFLHEERFNIVPNSGNSTATGGAAGDRRSISESGADSGASDSGVGSNVSQTSLPTTTPPASPGYVNVLSARTSGSAALIAGLNGQPQQAFGSDSSSGANLSRVSSGRASLKRSKTPPTHLKWVTTAAKSSQWVGGRNAVAPQPPSRATGPSALPVDAAANGTMVRSRSAESNVAHRIQPCVSVGDGGPGEQQTAQGGMQLSRSEHTLTTSAAAANNPVPPLPRVSTTSSSTDAMDAAAAGSAVGSNLLSPTSPSHAQHSPSHFFDMNKGGGVLPAPKSPRTGRILHEIPHAWERCRGSMTKQCYVCRKVLGFFADREKCQRCKARIHTSCKSDMPPNACGLTKDHVLYMYNMYMLQDEGGWSGAPSTPAAGTGDAPPSSIANSRSMPRIDEMNPADHSGVVGQQGGLFQYPVVDMSGVDSSSSTNSSAPSTPAPYNRAMTAPPHSAHSVYSARSSGSAAAAEPKFVFPDREMPKISEPRNEELISSVKSGDSDMTVRVSSLDSHPFTVGSSVPFGCASTCDVALQGSAGGSSLDESGGYLVGRTASIDSATQVSVPSSSSLGEHSAHSAADQPQSPSGSGGAVRSRAHWSRGTVRGPSTSWRDVTIPFDEIQFSSDSMIGLGRFGPVHRGYWHQDVAVKLLNMDHVKVDDDSQMLHTFKQEVDSFRNTRHDNIVLFLGYCLDPPKLAIVMNYCKGRTLYSILHRNRERIDFQKAVSIAKHITQGMSYLHQRHILHKDVRTKNIFVEPNNKIMITDFGLFSLKRLRTPMMNMEHAQDAHVLPNGDTHVAQLYAQSSYVQVPEHWLCYLAPELLRAIPCSFEGDVPELPFSIASDVYAFGTVWYELLTGEFPFVHLPPDAIVWQVGRGIRPALNNLQAPKEIKDILIRCWAYAPEDRPKFDELFQMMDKMPKKRLARSPSHPVQLSRSVESVF